MELMLTAVHPNAPDYIVVVLDACVPGATDRPYSGLAGREYADTEALDEGDFGPIERLARARRCPA